MLFIKRRVPHIPQATFCEGHMLASFCTPAGGEENNRTQDLSASEPQRPEVSWRCGLVCGSSATRWWKGLYWFSSPWLSYIEVQRVQLVATARIHQWKRNARTLVSHAYLLRLVATLWIVFRKGKTSQLYDQHAHSQSKNNLPPDIKALFFRCNKAIRPELFPFEIMNKRSELRQPFCRSGN